MCSPSVMLAAAPKLTAFRGASPWSWYIASTASAGWRPETTRGNSVSAAKGPETSIPSARNVASAGPITRSSSSPSSPASPAWGFKPQTAMRGDAIPKSRTSPSCSERPAATTRSSVTASATARSGMWAVTSPTRSDGPARSIVTGPEAAQASRHSVWPVTGSPQRPSSALCQGRVTTAAISPRSALSVACLSAACWSVPKAGTALPQG